MIWPLLVSAAAALQIVRNASQRHLSERLGLWGATYVRFIYGLPFALIWLIAIIFWRGWSGGPSLHFALWIILGAGAQVLATAALVFAMRGRAFAVANTLQKTEILSSAILGILIIQDVLEISDWIGVILGTAGVMLMVRVSIGRDALKAALSGAAAGMIFAVASVAYRAATFAWSGDSWISAAISLNATLAVQTFAGAFLFIILAPKTLMELFRSWRPCLLPGGAGAFSSALLFTGFALGPSVAAVKTVQLTDVVMGWLVSRRVFREAVRPTELAGIALVLAGAIAVLI